MKHVDAVAGIDSGTSGCKVTVLSADGRILGSAYRPYPTHHDQHGWAEQDPYDWVTASHEALVEGLREAQREVHVELRGLAFSAPHHVAVLLDSEGSPTRRSIMWTDQRSAGIARKMADTRAEQIWSACNNRPAATWTLPQMCWLQMHDPSSLNRVRQVVFMKDFVRRSFLDAPLTDHVDAAGSMLYDIWNRSWSPGLVELAGLSLDAMPTLVEPSESVGRISADVAESLGLNGDVQVIAGSADTATELLAARGSRPGDHTLKLATAGNVSRVSATPADTPDVITYPYLLGDSYYLNSATNSAAASFEWLATVLTGPQVAPDSQFFSRLDVEADAISAGSDGLIFHPYLNGERAPHWNPALRASFTGLSARHTRGHVARAAMEGVAMSMRDALGEGAQVHQATLIGGGAKSRVWGEIMAAVFNAELLVPRVADSSLGGAMLAAAGIGWVAKLQDCLELVQVPVERISPDSQSIIAYDEIFRRYRRIQRALQAGYEEDYQD